MPVSSHCLIMRTIYLLNLRKVLLIQKSVKNKTKLKSGKEGYIIILCKLISKGKFKVWKITMTK